MSETTMEKPSDIPAPQKGIQPLVSLIESEGYEILDSGVVILPKAYAQVKFRVLDATLVIKFSGHQPAHGQSLNIDFLPDNIVEITCVNWRGPDALGTGELANILLIDGEKLYFRFMLESPESMPRLTYTFYRQLKDADNV